MQRRYDLDLTADHLLGEESADRVRNRIVHMQEIQVLHFGDLRHFGRKRQIIRGVAEDVIIVDLHLMVKNIFLKRS
ncbi:hypothetical protein D3C71_1868040 [compost metagenome]